MDELSPFDCHLEDLISRALQEDLPQGDLTTQLIIPDSFHASATILAKEPGVLAGAVIVHRVFSQIDPSLQVTSLHQDGSYVEKQTNVIEVCGKARSILTAERVALNFLQRLSGIATYTYRICQAVKGYPVKILDTRKTTPGLRQLEKWAVALGGGTNHRMSLSDGILIKDNHLAVLLQNGIDISEACHQAKTQAKGRTVTVEVDTIDQVRLALPEKPDIFLLDNMNVEQIREALHLIQGQSRTEISGGVTLNNVRNFASTGVDAISIGSLTHSAPAMDFSLHFEGIPRPEASSHA